MKCFNWGCALLMLLLVGCFYPLSGQRIHRFGTSEMELIYFGKRYSYLMPHVAGTFYNALDFHKEHWDYQHRMTYVMLSDFEDDGHGGAIVMPFNMVVLGISPFNYAFNITPSSERFQWLSNHELTHITLADKANKRDQFWRKMMLGKVVRDQKAPVSALWSYLTTPRWYAPRWYHEGIACYLETWTSGGLGRALGPYDEMYFRSIVNEGDRIYSPVGLETEGTTIDFQVGANAYLYGTRFITYLSQQYGEEKLKAFYSRTDESSAFYGTQFRRVYGKPVQEAWMEWIGFERQFQQSNLALIRAYPQNAFRPITDAPIGSVSTVGFDASENTVYAAINHPGSVAQIVAIEIESGRIRKVAEVNSPMLYSVTFLAFDAERKQIFISEQNNKYRSLVQIDGLTGKRKTLIRYSRTGNLAFNPTDRSLWGVQHDNGYAKLVKIPEPYDKIIPMYTADFGKSMLDLDISGDGKKLSATLTGIRGEQSLIMFDLGALEMGSKSFTTVHQLDDNTLSQFRFSPDGQYLVGTSYYTGVSNIWRIGLADQSFELLSNDDNGLFAPLYVSSDSLFVLKFHRNGMQPGLIPVQVFEDANPIEFLGNLAIRKNPGLKDYSLAPASHVNTDSLKITEAPYIPLKNMSLINAFPDISGYKQTIALGYRINWSDRTGISNMSLFLGGSPWSPYPDRQKFHGQFKWNYWFWTFHANWNQTDFYDLFGPIRRSRAGYSLGVSYRKNHLLQSPLKWYYGFSINHYGDLEVLPQFQDVASPIQDLQDASIEAGISKLRRTLGAVEDEKGYRWAVTGHSYLAGKSLYASLISEQHFGWLVPGVRNTSFWIRSSAGHAFGAKESPFSRFYFGGFRNNIVDCQPVDQYRDVLAFPGADIDAVYAGSFLKIMEELNLKPLRIRDAGFTWLYPSFIKSSLFATQLLLDPFSGNDRGVVFNAGIQVDMEVVLFSYLKTTWSVGYAGKFQQSGSPEGEWMFSLKLLGN
ncbi:MAG: hypothetical protein R6V49_06180 [Bacteroidales bacterium]